jgi:hypothetical protein
MKIYFGCPRASLQQEEARYLSILQFLKENYDCELARDWVERTLNDIRCGLPAPSYEVLREEILRDIDSADLTIFEITQKSMGLGQQLMYALDQKKPTLILNDLSISRPVRDIFIITKDHQPIAGDYSSSDEMIDHVANFMNTQELRRHKRITLDVDASLHRELDRLADIEHRTRRDVVEDHIRKYRDGRRGI